MTSMLAKPLPSQRQGSRPTSASSGSVVTVQRASNNASSSRPTVTGLRAKSPNENLSMNFTTRNQSPNPERLSPESTRRSSAFYLRPDSRQGHAEANANLNRWSQSTGSSRRSSENYRTKPSFSKRLSGSIGSFTGFGSPQAPSPNPKSNKRPRSPPTHRPFQQPLLSPLPPHSAPTLPPLVTLSSLSQAVDAEDSPSTNSALTPATAELRSPYTNLTSEQDYFGDRWSNASPNRPPSKGKRVSSAGPSSRASPASDQPPDRPLSKVPESLYSPRASTFAKQGDRRQSAQHRNRANSAKSAGTTEGESSASDHRDRPHRNQRRRAPSQKALLSKALSKANHAVVLDGKQNVEGAILAYGDACHLLRQVMVRSSGEDDRRKLEAVRNTYKNRIVELQSSEQSYASSDSKALPPRPPERDSGQSELTVVTDEDEDVGLQARSAVPVGHDSGYGSMRYRQIVESPPYIPPRRQSLHSSVNRSEGNAYPKYSTEPGRTIEPSMHLQTPLYKEDMPPPLSPRRPLSPAPAPRHEAEDDSEPVKETNDQHTSWLNTINESSGSSAASVHSRRSSFGLRRKRIRSASGATEADFNAALDAAIETAYDDGFEPDDEEDDEMDLMDDSHYQPDPPDPFSDIRRNVEIARDNAREAERQAAISQARSTERLQEQSLVAPRNSLDGYGDDEGDEEERMLEEWTRDFVLDDTEYSTQTKSALPRQSDSSGFSGRTWGSIGSSPMSASLPAVAEVANLPSLSAQMNEKPVPPPIHPPPSSALPPPPAPPGSGSDTSTNGPLPRSAGFSSRGTSPGVRERRLSGIKARQLKIETNTSPYGPLAQAPKTQPAPAVAPLLQASSDAPLLAYNTDPYLTEDSTLALHSPALREAFPTSATLASSRKGSFPLTGSDAGEPLSATASAITKVTSADSETLAASNPSSPARLQSRGATGLRKNFSSSSLRSKSFTAGGENQEPSPNTSLSSIGSATRIPQVPSPAVPVLPTPAETNYLPKGQPSAGIYLFDCDIHSPTHAGQPNPLAANAPLPLEPCPESPLLRPFWLLRAIYQTIAHPRGGYITSKLFVPRDIWRVKNLKLKNVEEKVSTCDLLTAALLKLGKVDTLNADAVLEEMQFLETIMDRAQANLSKKLGSEVGVQGAAGTFKNAPTLDTDGASNTDANLPPSATSSNKFNPKSWRKLRSTKSLGAGATPASVARNHHHGGGDPTSSKEAPTMPSLPMTTAQNPRFPKRDLSQVQCMGPNPSYMGALARLCDAAQILDQIARQVEDPGLKHSSPAQVGLEFCTRHAADFFGFYICRFVFADIGLMLDKYIKRGGEWVMA